MVATPRASIRSFWARLAALDDLSGDGPFAASAQGVDLVIVRRRGELRVFEGRCPHQGALLGEGELDGGALVGRNHRGRLDTGTGQRAGGAECLRACPSQVRDGALWADVAELDGPAAMSARRTLDDLPGPRGLALLGSVLSPEPGLHRLLEAWAREHGPAYLVRVGRRRFVVVSDPAMTAQALQERPETYRRDSRFEPIFRELGVAGVFAAEGRQWRPQRRLAMEALSQRNLRGSYPIVRRVAERLHARWGRAADAGA